MATKKQYCLFDHTAMVYLNSLVFENDAKAIQWFTTVVNTDDNQQAPALYPESFTLFRLMDFNDKTGIYQPRDSEQIKAADLDSLPQDNQPKAIITGVEVADKVNMKFTMKQLLTALKSDLITADLKDAEPVQIAREVTN